MDDKIQQEIKDRMAQLLTGYTVDIIQMCDMYGLDRNSMVRQAATMFNAMAEHSDFEQFRVE